MKNYVTSGWDGWEDDRRDDPDTHTSTYSDTADLNIIFEVEAEVSDNRVYIPDGSYSILDSDILVEDGAMYLDQDVYGIPNGYDGRANMLFQYDDDDILDNIADLLENNEIHNLSNGHVYILRGKAHLHYSFKYSYESYTESYEPLDEDDVIGIIEIRYPEEDSVDNIELDLSKSSIQNLEKECIG